MRSITPHSATPFHSLRHHCTGDHTFTQDETEFLAAIEEFKKTSGKKFPTWTDALRVLMSIGYSRISLVTGHGTAAQDVDPLVDALADRPDDWDAGPPRNAIFVA